MSTSLSLIDAGQLIRMVPLSESKTVEVTGVSLDGVVLLLDRFPEFKALITPKRGEVDPDQFSFEKLIQMGPRIIGAIIAAGTGEPGSEQAENIAKNLPLGLQGKLIREIMDVTFPGGLASFIEDLRGMGLLGLAKDDEKVSELRGASEDTGKDQASSSSPQPPASDPSATQKS